MAKTEITWNALRRLGIGLDIHRREVLSLKASPRDALADKFQLSQRPSPIRHDLWYGQARFPSDLHDATFSQNVLQVAEREDGRYYRLPTEANGSMLAEQERRRAYSFGDDAALLDEYAWYSENTKADTRRSARRDPIHGACMTCMAT